ncbi:MAG: hypothetical protein ACQCN3_00625 [Candidatus Bathyarchaeia archaeon]|jgi:hypothetical protein
MSNQEDREFQIAIARLQSLSDWVNSGLAIAASVIIALGILFTQPFFGSGTIDERVLFLPNAGLMAIVGALLFLGLVLFNVVYMRWRWSCLHKRFVKTSQSTLPTKPTKEENKKEETGKQLTYEDLILNLIQKIEDKKSELFSAKSFFWANKRLIALIIMLGFFFFSLYLVAIVIYAVGSSLGVNVIAIILAFFSASLALVASTYAMYNFILQVADREMIDLNFKIITKDVANEDEKVLLRALLKIKSKNKDIDLRRIYAMNKDLFTREKLAEKLCE